MEISDLEKEIEEILSQCTGTEYHEGYDSGGEYIELEEDKFDNDMGLGLIRDLVIKSMIKENESILQMANLHMNDRAIMVLKDRISELKKLIE